MMWIFCGFFCVCLVCVVWYWFLFLVLFVWFWARPVGRVRFRCCLWFICCVFGRFFERGEVMLWRVVIGVV